MIIFFLCYGCRLLLLPREYVALHAGVRGVNLMSITIPSANTLNAKNQRADNQLCKSYQITVEQWQQFALGLRHHLAAKDWDRLVKLNKLLIKALIQVSKSDFTETSAQAIARKDVAMVHAQVLNELKSSRDAMAVELERFKSSQVGLSAYQFTCISGEADDI